MAEEQTNKGWDFSKCNWPGIVGGILLLILPFTGGWWIMHVGAGAFDVSLSPFTTEIMMFGEAVASPLLFWLNIAFTILMFLFGILLLIGSITFANEKYRITADTLVKINSRKPLYLMMIFTIGLVFFNWYLGQMLIASGFSGSFPILIGDGSASMVSGGFVIHVPVSLELSTSYWTGLTAAIIAFTAGFYQKKINPSKE